MVINRGQWSFRDPGNDIPDGSTINSGNFQQKQPDTPILVGKTLTINGGNWTNVLIDAAWTISGGNFSNVSRCYWLHPEWELPVEVDNCSHVIEIDTITIDGQLVNTEYHRQDTAV